MLMKLAKPCLLFITLCACIWNYVILVVEQILTDEDYCNFFPLEFNGGISVHKFSIIIFYRHGYALDK